MHKFVNRLAFSLLLATAVTSVHAQTVLFDSKALSESAGYGESWETRSSDFNYGLVASFNQDTTVNELGIWTSIDQEQDVKFLIFDSYVGGGSGALLFSQAKHFAQNSSQQWIYSDSFDFTFQAGHTYDIGILGNGNTLTGMYSYGGTVSQNGITGINNNANFDSFSNPETDPGDYASVLPYVQLIQTGGAVPEPASWALMLGGFGMVGGALRSRKKVAARFA